MYINPFIAGIFATLFAEILIATIYVIRKEAKKK